MTIRYTCDKCDSTLKIKDELAGQPGKCPKCKSKFTIPDVSSDEDGAPARPLTEEEEIFGEDFFKVDAPKGPRQYSMPDFDDDDDSEDEPAKPVKPAKVKIQPLTAASPDTTVNAASVASSLLSRTGKKNRPDEVEEPAADDDGYDFTELKYLLKTRIVPGVAVVLVVVIGLYKLFSGMIAATDDTPPLAPVTGIVSVDGRATAGVRLDFICQIDAERSISCMATSGPDGRYEAILNSDVKGAPVGENLVRIQYGATIETKTVLIADTDNVFDFDISSASQAIPQ